MSTILILGCGAAQAAIIIKAQKMGFKIIGVDKNPNAHTAKIVDIFICESTYCFKDLNKNPKFFLIDKIKGLLIKSSGFPVLTSSEIAKKFNIPNVPLKSVEVCIYKDRFKTFCKENKIFTASSITLNELPSQSFLLEKGMEFPLVLRPAISVKGKSNIYLIKNFDDLKIYFDQALRVPLNNKVILDRYIDGIDYQILGFVEKSIFYQTSILEEMNYFATDSKLYNIGFRTLDKFPDDSLKDKINNIISLLIKKLSIERSPLSISLRISTDKKYIFLVEIHLDLGGEYLIDYFLPKSMNIDILKGAINASIGNINEIQNIQIFPKAIIFNDPRDRSSGYKIFSYNSFFELDEKIKDIKIEKKLIK